MEMNLYEIPARRCCENSALLGAFRIGVKVVRQSSWMPDQSRLRSSVEETRFVNAYGSGSRCPFDGGELDPQANIPMPFFSGTSTASKRKVGWLQHDSDSRRKAALLFNALRRYKVSLNFSEAECFLGDHENGFKTTLIEEL